MAVREFFCRRRVAAAQRKHDARGNQRKAEPEIERHGLRKQQPAEERPHNRLEKHEKAGK